MSSIRSILLLCIVTLSMTVLAAPVTQVGGLVPALSSGSGTGSTSDSSSPHGSSAGTGTGQPGATAPKDVGDALADTVNNGNLNGNKIITSVNTLNDVLNDVLNDSFNNADILSNNPIASGNNIANIGGGAVN